MNRVIGLAIVLLLTACGTTTTPVDPSLIVGSVSNYTLGAAEIFANDVEGFAADRSVGQGELNADGTFSVQLSKTLADDVLGPPFIGMQVIL
jgi:hypothetical protein